MTTAACDVSVAVLDRSDGGDPDVEVEALVSALTATTGGLGADPDVGSTTDRPTVGPPGAARPTTEDPS